MDNKTLVERLPPLPKSFGDHCVVNSVRTMREPGYTAEQMREYAAAALRATTGEGECCHSYPCQRPGSVRGACTMEAPTPAEPLRDAGAVDAAALGRLAQDAWMDAHDDYPAWGFLSETERAAWLAVGERIARALSTRPAPAQVDEGALLARANEVVHHDAACPAIGGNGDTDCRCDAVPFLRDLAAALAAAAQEVDRG